ncbi:MAG: hypothetical protein CM15mP65_02410 [Crocinitomicaceae bacterium]|nr:MAG: hypothetical protein CM15mP65_02410 [Crocinitomicaceae bacterium]
MPSYWGLGTGYQYSWNSGLSDTSHHLVYPLYSKNYTVTVNDACETPPVSGSVYITVFPLPPADFTVDVTEGCLPLDVEFTNCFLTLQALVIGILVILPFLINVERFLTPIALKDVGMLPHVYGQFKLL